MKIRIDGITLDQYAKTENRFEELKYSLENIEFAEYDKFDKLVDISNEDSILGDLVKGTVKGTFKSVKYGVKGVRAANRQWTYMKNNWEKIKPQLIKVLKDMSIGLGNMWHKYLQFDEKYKELGKKISNIINFSVNQMQTMPSVKLVWHKFNAVLLKGIIDLVSNWFNFVNAIINGSSDASSRIFQGTGNKQPIPQNIVNALKRDDLDLAREMIQDFSKGIANLNQNGDLTIAYILDKIFKWNIKWNAPKETKKAAKGNNVTLSEYIKDAILGDLVEKEYGDGNKQEFVKDMTGSKGAYLYLVASILNNDVLADALKKGGASTKKGTDAMVKSLDTLMKQSELVEKIKADKENKAAEAKMKQEERAGKSQVIDNDDEDNDSNISSNMYEAGQQFGSSSNSNQKMQEGTYNDNSDPEASLSNAGIADLADLFAKNYVIFITKLSNTYANLVRGILAATYEIIAEADSIIDVIETSANRVKS